MYISYTILSGCSLSFLPLNNTSGKIAFICALVVQLFVDVPFYVCFYDCALYACLCFPFKFTCIVSFPPYECLYFWLIV